MMYKARFPLPGYLPAAVGRPTRPTAKHTQVNFAGRGKPVGGNFPADARLPSHGVISLSVRVRPPPAFQDNPVADE